MWRLPHLWHFQDSVIRSNNQGIDNRLEVVESAYSTPQRYCSDSCTRWHASNSATWTIWCDRPYGVGSKGGGERYPVEFVAPVRESQCNSPGSGARPCHLQWRIICLWKTGSNLPVGPGRERMSQIGWKWYLQDWAQEVLEDTSKLHEQLTQTNLLSTWDHPRAPPSGHAHGCMGIL